MMSDEEIKLLREGLKLKWNMVNKEYQQITHISEVKTVGLKRRYDLFNEDFALFLTPID